MNCRTFEERVYDLCDGELKAADERLMLAHAESCPNCRALFKAHRAVVEQLRSLPRAVPPPETASVVMAAIREREARLFRERALRWSSVAAMILAGAVGLFFHSDLFRTATTIGFQVNENAAAAFQRIGLLFSQSVTGIAAGANQVLSVASSAFPATLSSSAASGALLLLLAGLGVIATNYRLLREVAQD